MSRGHGSAPVVGGAATGIAPWTRNSPCPVCGGHPSMPRGAGSRDWGFAAGPYARCSRPEHAGALLPGRDGLYGHFTAAPCRCGRDHRDARADFTPRVSPMAKVANQAKVSADLVEHIWRDSLPAAGTIVETYLASRALTGPIPSSIRFAPALRHAPTSRTLPAIVAAVMLWPSARPVALHRTYLRPDGRGKADAEPNRMMIGPVAGGAVRLSPPAETMAVAEGIETALSVAQATGIPTWAALSAIGIERLRLPDLPHAATVVIAADNDDAGLRSAHNAAERWIGEGRTVRIATPPNGHNDFNDALQSEARR